MIYRYIGPADVLARSRGQAPGAVILDRDALRTWLRSTGVTRGSVTCTFVIDESALLRLADRHCEHVACSGGTPVRSAGEITFRRAGETIEVDAVSNLSTGFCPEPESWPVVEAALARLGLVAPSAWTSAYEFRRCSACGERNVIKDDWYVCDVCEAPLSEHWNFAP
jgi:hypothetical protein